MLKPVPELAALVRGGEISAREVVGAALRRIEDLDDRINAFIEVDDVRALGMVAYDAARMLGIPAERERVRICASDTCSARFYDRSPAGARRWCSMAGCGNQNKARRYRSRHG